MHGICGVFFDFRAQPLDVNVKGFCVANVVSTPNSIDELISREKPGNKGGITKKPVVRYQTWNGESVVFENRFGSSNWKIQVGDVVEIMVDPEAPQKAEVIHFFSQKGFPMILFFLRKVHISRWDLFAFQFPRLSYVPVDS